MNKRLFFFFLVWSDEVYVLVIHITEEQGLSFDFLHVPNIVWAKKGLNLCLFLTIAKASVSSLSSVTVRPLRTGTVLYF